MKTVGEQFTESIFKEINGTFNNIMGKRSVVDEVSVNFKAVCPDHKEHEPAYCLCGVNEEKKENLENPNGKKKDRAIESIFCNGCGTWYHSECVNKVSKPKRKSKKVTVEESYFNCPTCVALQEMCKNPGKFMKELSSKIALREKMGRGGKNFIQERLNHVLKRDFVQFNMYVIALKSLKNNLKLLSLDNIRYW